MISNYLKIALRNILRNKIFSIINIVGLSIALASTFYILVFVVNELSYDECHLKNERIYRVNTHMTKFNVRQATTPFVLTTHLKDENGEIEKIARFSIVTNVQLKLNNVFISETGIQAADQDIFEVFTLPIISGTNDISDKNSIVISEDMATKYFGNESPIDKVLEANILGEEYLFRVSGVMKNILRNSTFYANILVNIELSFDNLRSFRDPRTSWLSGYWHTYLLLNPKALPSQFEEQLQKLVLQNNHEEYIDRYELQNLKDVYLHSSGIYQSFPKGDLDSIYLYIIIGLGILLIASSNYIILSTALSSNRAKEIGIRKVIGATKQNLIYQVLAESLLIVFCALLIAITIIEVIHPYAQELFLYDFNILSENYPTYILGFSLVMIIIGFLSSSYIAFYLSSLPIVDIIKTKIMLVKKGKVRKALILFQLSVFTVLLFSMIILNKQYNFMKTMDPGFNEDNIIIITYNNKKFQSVRAYKNNICKNTNVLNSSLSVFSPPNNSRIVSPIKVPSDPSEEIMVEFLSVDYNFIETLGLEIIRGRSFLEEFSDQGGSVIFNESAIKALGIEEPIGKEIESRTIVGVVKDFNLHSLHSEIPPLGLRLSEDKFFRIIVVKYKEGTYRQTKDFLQSEWNKLTDIPFNSQTFEETLTELYEDEKKLINIITFYTILSIILAASGIFGLTLFSMKKRTKEIGVRKVLGASTIKIFIHLNKEFILLIIVASIIALPIAYYLMDEWLLNFAYRIGIGISPFIISIATLFVIVITSISIQTIKAAKSNPVDSLRDE